MEQNKNLYHCLNCHQSEANMPLVALRYAQNETWICTQCLPILIHQPQHLVTKLALVDKSPAARPGNEKP